MQPSKTMKTLIERAYQIFSRYPVPPQFDVCCHYCVSKEEEQALRQTPLRELSFKQINAYNQHALSDEQNSSKIRYILPPLLEVIAHGQYPGISEEVSLARVGSANPEKWPPAEYEILVEFARQFTIERLTEAQHNNQLVDLDIILIMFHLAGLDVTPLLTVALEQPGFWPLASLAMMLVMERSEGQLINAFATTRKKDNLNQRINVWLKHASPQLSERAAKAIASPPDLKRQWEQYYSGATLGYWIEESLCVLYDQKA